MTNDGRMKSGRSFASAKRALRTSNNLVVMICLFVLSNSIYGMMEGERNGRITVEDSALIEIKLNLAHFSAIVCIHVNGFILAAYIKVGSKRLFRAGANRRRATVGSLASSSVQRSAPRSAPRLQRSQLLGQQLLGCPER